MMGVPGIIEGVIERVRPSAVERRKVQAAVDDVLAKVKDQAKEAPYHLDVKLVGSAAKDTYVFPPDLDVFVLFPPRVPRSELEKRGLGIGRRVLGGEERYAEHPYIHGKLRGFKVDIVPCYAIDDPRELQSAVDRTPFHTDYVISHLKPEQHDQVRLLKQFMKGIGTYSAEAKVQGFSGYLVELLILRYGDFQGVLEASRDWGEGLALSIAEGAGRRFASPMTFYDPVDPERNVASALSLQNMAVFIRASREFLAKPDIRFFFPRPHSVWTRSRVSKEMGRRGTRLIAVQLARPDLTDDNLYPQARKTLDGMQSTLEAAGFIVLDRCSQIRAGKIDLIMELQTDRLPRTVRHLGPPVTSQHCAKFLEKWNEGSVVRPYIENGRWVAIIRRPYRDAKDLLIHEMHKAGLGSEMKGLEGMRVLSHQQLMKHGPLSSITALLDKTAPWER
jgi:tRNA nucleotidyltransferase (CCA-adding enzyme)